MAYDGDGVAALSDDAPQQLRRSDGPGIVASVWRYSVTVAAVTIVSVVLGFLVSVLLLPTTYEATSTVVISDVDAFDQDPPAPERRVPQEHSRLTSRAVFSLAGRQLRPPLDVEELQETVDVVADAVTGEIEVTASAGTARRAVAIADAIVSTYEQLSQEAAQARLERARGVIEQESQRLRDRIDAITNGADITPAEAQRIEILQSQLGELDARISELAADVALYGSGIEQIEPAALPEEPSGPQPVRNALLAGLVGLLVASAVAYWRAGYVDSQRLDPAQVLDAPLLAEIPQLRRHTDEWINPLFDVEVAEAYQFLVASFEYAIDRHGMRSVLITSAGPGDGKSLTSIQLARALAIQDRDVCLVDADIRARGVSSVLRAGSSGGLMALAEGMSLDSVVRRCRISEQIDLPLIPAGQPPTQPTGLLGTARYRRALSTIISRYDVTIIDSGPLLTVADASVISCLVSGIMLVLDVDVSREDLAKVRNRLKVIPTPLLGIVVNRVPDERSPPYPDWSVPVPGTAQRLSRMLFRRGRSDDATESVPTPSSR